jgi:hypothetical protein
MTVDLVDRLFDEGRDYNLAICINYVLTVVFSSSFCKAEVRYLYLALALLVYVFSMDHKCTATIGRTLVP